MPGAAWQGNNCRCRLSSPLFTLLPQLCWANDVSKCDIYVLPLQCLQTFSAFLVVVGSVNSKLLLQHLPARRDAMQAPRPNTKQTARARGHAALLSKFPLLCCVVHLPSTENRSDALRCPGELVNAQDSRTDLASACPANVTPARPRLAQRLHAPKDVAHVMHRQMEVSCQVSTIIKRLLRQLRSTKFHDVSRLPRVETTHSRVNKQLRRGT